MKRQPQAINTMQMVRKIRDKLGKLRREDSEEYFKRLDKHYETAQRLLNKQRRAATHKTS